jgi:hypothetical protein
MGRANLFQGNEEPAAIKGTKTSVIPTLKAKMHICRRGIHLIQLF